MSLKKKLEVGTLGRGLGWTERERVLGKEKLRIVCQCVYLCSPETEIDEDRLIVIAKGRMMESPGEREETDFERGVRLCVM